MMKKLFLLLVGLVSAFALGYWTAGTGENTAGTVNNNGTERRDTVVVEVLRVDTVHVIEPHMMYERTTDTVRVLVPVSGLPDVPLTLPRVQRMFEGDNYRAWVSGVSVSGYGSDDAGPVLDSLCIERDVIETTITIHERERRKRWGLGVSAGVHYDLAKGKPGPYLGVGVSYNLCRW